MVENIRTKKLMTTKAARAKVPLSVSLKRRITQDRNEIKDIISGKDNRLLLIVGPCSAWPYNAVRVYAEQLAELAKLYKDDIKIIMRVYTQKPRTTVGWAGVALQSNPFKAPDINVGTIYVRKMMREIVEMDLAIADEILFTHLFGYRSDFLSWAAIGARSSEDQEHRAFASGMPFAVGVKNPTSGDIKIGVNGVVSAQSEHIYARKLRQIISSGNEFAHLVLRGGVNGSNYSLRDLKRVMTLYDEYQIKNPAIIIDASHDNTLINDKKDYERQERTVLDVLSTCKKNKNVQKAVKGFLIESFMKSGSQNIKKEESVDLSGLSITDACIGINQTRALIEKIVTTTKS